VILKNNITRPFHLAFPVKNLDETEKWYTAIIGCTIGRKSNKWIDFNFFGHQIVAHLVNDIEEIETNEVDENNVPSRHFGIILTPERWKKLVAHLKSKNIKFHIKPHTRFKDKVGEQHTMFIQDPSGNFLEFKAFEDDKYIFQK
tara:strand:+ start:784 stop:1215 length:432 start_codon:yes stop_codon:yes gene_type:complete